MIPEHNFKRAYSDLYLDDVLLKLGSLFTYGVYDYKYTIEYVWDKFTSSVYGGLFNETGISAIGGRSGIEIWQSIEKGDEYGSFAPFPNHRLVRDSVFWSGWVMAYYQWYTGQPFNTLGKEINISDIESMYYPLHEADIGHVVDTLIKYQRFNEDTYRIT